MAWITTKDGRRVNTDWFDKEHQIAKNKAQADIASGKRLDSKAPEEQLRKELEAKLLDKDSYMFSDTYKDLSNTTIELGQQLDEAIKRRSELWEIEKKGTTIDEETLREFGGDRQLARLFGTKSEEAIKASQELEELRGKISNLEDKLSTVRTKLSDYEMVHRRTQTAYNDMKDSKKDNYVGFEKDTHISYYQQLYKEGKARIVEMSPKEYLQRCATDIFDSTYERQVRAVVADARHTYELADMMREGTKMYMPMLNFKENRQEGRHRAVAAILNGIDVMPVMIVDKR